MNLGRYLQLHKNEAKKMAENIINFSPDLRVTKLLEMIENAFGDGALSMVKAKKPSCSVKEASNSLSEASATGFLEENIGVIIESLCSIITDITEKGRLKAGWKDVVTEEYAEIAYTLYNLGFLAGVTISQDPEAFKLYCKNREEMYES